MIWIEYENLTMKPEPIGLKLTGRKRREVKC
jgi:hypothetical protein